MLTRIDRFLNSITMYNLVLKGLQVMIAYSVFLAFIGKLPHGGWSYVLLFLVLTVTCYTANYFLAKTVGAPINKESASITAFILFFVMFPVTGWTAAITAAFAGFVAMASKYVLAINRRHIFNPVAIAALAVSLTAALATALPGLKSYINAGSAVWWVGTPWMLPATLVLGLLVVRKIRKFAMFLAFVFGSVISTLIIDPSILVQNFVSWPLVFFGTIMLTEPFTMPPHRKTQVVFGFAVGLLFSAQYSFGPFYSTPELALIIGNLFAYVVSLKRRAILTLKEKKLVSKDTYEFSFVPDGPFPYKAGQYMEWTLPDNGSDARGNRRYFTVASSPTESDVKLGIKFYEPSSTFKKSLGQLEVGKAVAAGQLGGDFVLPKDASKKLVFIAGGIGVTPFRSMIKYISDTGKKRDVVLIYSVKTEDEIAYRDVFEEGEQKFGLRVIYLVGNFLTDEYVRKEIPDFAERAFYLSGPNAMVENYKKLIRKMGVGRFRIHTDYFPGF